MADRKKQLRKRKENEAAAEIAKNEDERSKLEYDVAKYLRNKLPRKTTTLLRDKVDYFIASKAIDCLLDSVWASNTPANDQNEPIFTNRESVVDFLNTMLEHRFFHRASKIVVKDKKKIKDADDGSATDTSLGKKKTDKKKSDQCEDKKEKKKEKKKIKLDIHMTQIVVDSNEPYVWLYEPVSIKSWIFGFLLVIGVVGICLFPLWPSILRDIVYYLSLAAASFILFIIGLALVKGILFIVIWTLTFGKHHFWLLPNLTEDVGFFASFVPLYEHKTKDEIEKESDKQTKKSKTVKETKKKRKAQEETEQLDLKGENNGLDEQNNRSEGEEAVNNKQEEGSDSSENEKFEIVDDNEIPPILRLDL